MSISVRIAIIVGVVLVAGAMAWVSRRRDSGGGPVLAPFQVPTFIDRTDIQALTNEPLNDWVVLVASSVTCDSCAGVVERALPLASPHVSVVDASVQDFRSFHQKYGIDAVPMTLIIDTAGRVAKDFQGPVSSTHLWAAVAEAREPGSVPPGCGGDH